MENKNAFTAVLIGSGGGIGSALKKQLINSKSYARVICYSKNNDIKLDITNENEISKAANDLKQKGLKIDLLINTIGYLHEKDFFPEKKNF